MPISFEQKIVVLPDTLINVVSGESVILNLKTESYFGLDTIGTDMWQALTTSDSVQSAFESLLTQYDVGEETLKNDLSVFVDKLLQNGLVELGS